MKQESVTFVADVVVILSRQVSEMKSTTFAEELKSKEIVYETCSSEVDIEINHSCYPDREENARIVNWNELNPTHWKNSLGESENEGYEDGISYAHYQPDPFIIRNGSNFHATLSHEGLFPETYGSKELVQLINLDQNLMTEDLSLKQGQIFDLKDWEWNREDTKLSDSIINEDKHDIIIKGIFIESIIRDLYGRKVVDIYYLKVEDWEGYSDHNGNVIEPLKDKSLKEISKATSGYMFSCERNMVCQAGKILPAFRNDTYGITPTPEFYNFGDRDLFAELEAQELSAKKQAEREVQKEMKKEEQELAKKQQIGLECFF